MRMSTAELNDLLARNPKVTVDEVQTCGAEKGSVSQRSIRHESVGKAEGEEKNSGRIPVRITSFRRRLLDPDNLSAKYFTDCLRYAEMIPNDRPQDIDLTVSQVKVRSKLEEHTEIEIG